MNGPLFVSVDGFDGAGKSTLVAGLARALSRRGALIAVVDRTLPQSTPQIDSLARAIKRSDGGIQPLDELTDALVRAACARERVAVGRAADADVVLLDRWLLWDLSRTTDRAYATTREIFAEIVNGTGALVPLLLDIDFETAWARVAQRGTALSPRELLGADHNRTLHDRLPAGRDRLEECGASATVIDGRLTPDQVLDRALEVVGARMPDGMGAEFRLRADDVA